MRLTVDMFILPKRVIREMEDNNTYRCVWTCTTCVCTEEIAGKQFGGKKRYLKIRKNFLDYQYYLWGPADVLGWSESFDRVEIFFITQHVVQANQQYNNHR